MEPKSCGWIVLFKEGVPPKKIHFDADKFRTLDEFDIPEEELNKFLKDFEEDPSVFNQGARSGGPNDLPFERQLLIRSSLKSLIESSFINAARDKTFLQQTVSLLTQAQSVKGSAKETLGKAIRLIRDGLAQTNPALKEQLEAIGRLLPTQDQKFRFIAAFGKSIHKTTERAIIRAIKSEAHLRGSRMESEKTLLTIVRSLASPDQFKAAERMLDMKVKDYFDLHYPRGVAPLGTTAEKSASVGRRFDEAFLKKHGNSKMRDLIPDLVYIGPDRKVAGIYDLTGLNKEAIEASAELAARELGRNEAVAKKLAGLKGDALINAIESLGTEGVEVMLSQSKAIHAMRTKLITDFFLNSGLAGAGQAGDFYYQSLFVWGKAAL
jgi:hypothetical protein